MISLEYYLPFDSSCMWMFVLSALNVGYLFCLVLCNLHAMLTISENGHPKDIEFVGQPIVVTEGKGYIIVT